MKSEEQFEKLLQEALINQYSDESIPIPDPKNNWTILENYLIRDYKKIKRHRRLKKMSWIVAAMTILFISATFPPTSSAVIKFFNIIRDWQEDITRIVINRPTTNMNSNSYTLPPADDKSAIAEITETHQIKVTLEEAIKNLSFKPDVPDFPSHYKLENVYILSGLDREPSNWIRFEYTKGEQWFSIIEEKLMDNSAPTRQVTNATVEEVMIGDYEGVFVQFQNQVKSLDWVNDGIQYSIYGSLTREEIFELANELTMIK
jgi:hypothetical protein